MSRLVDEFPLHKFGDKIVEAMAEFGIPFGGISIVITDLVNGFVSSTSNLDNEAELQLLRFALQERESGNYTEADVDPKEETVQ